MLGQALRNAARQAAPMARSGVRNMSINDVKLKDLPAHLQQVAADPATKKAADSMMYNYYKTYVKTGSAQPVYHVIAMMLACGYCIDYTFHLRHEANYKYH
eukprot:CAMPEP_0206278908 /NCGR_PEP_ID=MMETSP0047_2-20121206/37720_1 /ASSEMBLY_ACC=CAM_ASM_000192 /TAXON_ID=195065 /ORGANISM="Chroomonas mesostigmatica_cf, Strain CCMP1168" /LENGTH=100 /DNA_ID=CAMNT_0053708783 /DNA_START=5 /DNA_END=307 /DNA_ORIENTATION=+